MPGADDQPVVGLTAEEEALLAQYGGGGDLPSQPTGEPASEGVSSDHQTNRTEEPGQAPRQESRRDQPADEHPENLPFLFLEDDEQVIEEVRRRLEEEPLDLIKRLRNGAQRLSDYTRKTKAAADLRREAEELMRQAQETQERLRQQQTPPPQQPPQSPPTMMDIETYAQWFRQQYGREPTQADYLNYRLDALVESRLEAKVLEHTSKFEEQLKEREVQQAMQRLSAQYEELCREFPDAGDPQVQFEIADYLARMQSDLSGGDEVRRAYFALHGPELLERVRNEALNRRREQVERRRQEAAPPPGNAAAATTAVRPRSTSLDDIAEAQKNDPTLRQRLAELYHSMRGGVM